MSKDPRDTRLRCSAVIESTSHNVIIDVGPDFRAQALHHGLQSLDAVFITHEHNDHVAGLDDLRPLMFKNRKPMPVYAEKRVLEDVKIRYKYAFEEQPYPGAPRFDLHEIKPEDVIQIGPIKIKAIRAFHGSLPILSFVIQDYCAYMTDINEIPEETRSVLDKIDVLIVDMLREKGHHSHFSFNDACAFAASISARQTFFIHLSHLMGPTNQWETRLPKGVFPSYDGLSFDLPQISTNL